MKIPPRFKPSPLVFVCLFGLLVLGLAGCGSHPQPGALTPVAGGLGVAGEQIFLSVAGLFVFILALGLLVRRHVAQRTRVLRYQSQLLENASDQIAGSGSYAVITIASRSTLLYAITQWSCRPLTIPDTRQLG